MLAMSSIVSRVCRSFPCRRTRAMVIEGPDVLVEHLAVARLNVGDDLAELALAEPAVAQVPEFEVDKVGRPRLEVGRLDETVLPQADADAITRLYGPNRLNCTDEGVVGRSLLTGRHPALVGVEAGAEVAHVVILVGIASHRHTFRRPNAS